MGKARSLIDDIRNYINVTCYTHIKCNRIGGECLDWREICDGKNDCLDSVEDEKNCLELEINDCADEEYRCYNGMCISDSFLRDDPFNPECLDGSDEHGVIDCFENHDELHNESCFFHDKHRVNCSQDSDYCIKISAILNNKLIHCGTDLLNFNSYNYEIAFPTLCNSYLQINDLLGLSKDQETDENHCEWWPCNNQYTRCDTSWTCVNGADEWNCPQSTCPYNHMPCISPNTFTKFCLNISRIGDNIQDCLGATDEQAFCRSVFPLMDWRYKCWDSPVCTPIYFRPLPDYLCLDEKINETEADALLPLSSFWLRNPTYSNFGLESLPLTVTSKSFEQSRLSLKEIENPDFHLLPRISSSETDNVTSKLGPCEAWLCNRGILILKELERKEYCLCPQSYYGDRCQYQSDRVSITLQFRRQTIPENIQEVFSFVVNLFDNNDVIHSSDYFTYLPKSSCNTKFNRYLLYDSPAKDKTKNYTVRIDSYNRIDPTHYASWLLPIKFPFLPVYRIAFHLTLPMKQSVMVRECPMSCVHGYCTKYINQLEQSYYCQCYSGWSGSRCTVLLNCNCSNGSFCVGVTRNRAICVCPLRKLGPRCFLQSVCYTDTCKNGGVCVPTDERISSHPSFTCMCSKGFWGFNCELKETKIVISFSKEIDIPQSIIVHFITVNKKADPTRITTLKKVPSVVNEVTLLVAKPFNLLFAQIQSNFYLTYLQKNSTLTSSGIIFGEISVSRQCFHIRQLFDDNVTTTYPLLRRVKYYHIPCDKRPDLSCFYDEEQFMCLCNEHHHANCFKFDFNITYNCWGRSECQNGAACYQDDPNCPTETLCVCPECYYGTILCLLVLVQTGISHRVKGSSTGHRNIGTKLVSPTGNVGVNVTWTFEVGNITRIHMAIYKMQAAQWAAIGLNLNRSMAPAHVFVCRRLVNDTVDMSRFMNPGKHQHPLPAGIAQGGVFTVEKATFDAGVVICQFTLSNFTTMTMKNSNDVPILSQSIPYHPLVAIGALNATNSMKEHGSDSFKALPQLVQLNCTEVITYHLESSKVHGKSKFLKVLDDKMAM
ncbi:unnamed protein product [Adineta steineri]|uniref:Uncharacterized protein n=1 Tax=Adineta steineri TaxID=433720 RepID=A0A814V393_9BILA|nr:unnamed protein product [Adineta steineri]CAF1416578.1 unnamed protein product [Adineta steineri]